LLLYKAFHFRLGVAGVLDVQSMRMLASPGTGDIARNGDKRA